MSNVLTGTEHGYAEPQTVTEYGVFADRSRPEHGGIGVVLVDTASTADRAERIASAVALTWPTFIRQRTITTGTWEPAENGGVA